jgi:hypothetical protein
MESSDLTMVQVTINIKADGHLTIDGVKAQIEAFLKGTYNKPGDVVSVEGGYRQGRAGEEG